MSHANQRWSMSKFHHLFHLQFNRSSCPLQRNAMENFHVEIVRVLLQWVFFFLVGYISSQHFSFRPLLLSLCDVRDFQQLISNRFSERVSFAPFTVPSLFFFLFRRSCSFVIIAGKSPLAYSITFHVSQRHSKDSSLFQCNGNVAFSFASKKARAQCNSNKKSNHLWNLQLPQLAMHSSANCHDNDFYSDLYLCTGNVYDMAVIFMRCGIFLWFKNAILTLIDRKWSISWHLLEYDRTGTFKYDAIYKLLWLHFTKCLKFAKVKQSKTILMYITLCC